MQSKQPAEETFSDRLASSCCEHSGFHWQAASGYMLRVRTVMLLRLQRYISTRPMFIDVRELSAGTGARDVTDAATAGIVLRDLSQQYKGLLAAVKEEALVMEQVFPSPRTALAIFVQRVFEQRVQVLAACETS